MNVRTPESKILSEAAMLEERRRLRDRGLKLAFTNGCFDILHAGHVDYLNFARNQADALAVGLNSDESVRLNKGAPRPFVPQAERARMLAALEAVDYVVIFEEKESAPLIGRILPDVLIKGEDWSHYISGADVVKANGGKIVLAKLTQGLSTTNIVKKILECGSSAKKPGS